jgi:hypothetical protein
MSAVSRRRVLKGGVMATAVAAVPVSAAALRQTRLVVYDSTLMQSRAFARAAGFAARLDLAQEHRERFATLRAGLTGNKAIDGLTRWSDWVALRSELESQGWRVATEARSGGLIRWTMRPR